jgi:hypothetical protein
LLEVKHTHEELNHPTKEKERLARDWKKVKGDLEVVVCRREAEIATPRSI